MWQYLALKLYTRPRHLEAETSEGCQSIIRPTNNGVSAASQMAEQARLWCAISEFSSVSERYSLGSACSAHLACWPRAGTHCLIQCCLKVIDGIFEL